MQQEINQLRKKLEEDQIVYSQNIQNSQATYALMQTEEEQKLMLSSKNIGLHHTNKQRLQRLLFLERAGVLDEDDKKFLEEFKLPSNTRMQVTLLDIAGGFVIEENGYFYEQYDVVNTGYWAWKKIAESLPYDYVFE